jgi:segregation and condensation protein A
VSPDDRAYPSVPPGNGSPAAEELVELTAAEEDALAQAAERIAAESADGSGPDPSGTTAVAGDGYRVRLDRFEGPLDLLLHLIREEKVDVTDIPIARITEQYLESIADIESLDLDRAGEYLLMAATLMRIKARMLVPRDPEEEEEEDEDPRAALVRRLLEYREFKRVAEALAERQEEWREIFYRSAAPLLESEEAEEAALDVSLVDILRAFQTVLDRLDRERPLELEGERYSVEEQMEFIRTACGRREEGVTFFELFERLLSRAFVITTFLALLEMMRNAEVAAHQVDRFGEIWIRPRAQAPRHAP